LTPTRDPLAGMRRAINDRELSTLRWPLIVDGAERPCPVAVGQVIELRTCHIEITRIERSKGGAKLSRLWLAFFARHDKRADKPILLSAGTGAPYTDDPAQALGLREDVFHGSALTLDAIEEEERSAEHKNAGEPLEPESVPPHEIKHYRGSRDAHQRRLLEVGGERVAQQAAPIEQRLAALREQSALRHVDISSDIRVIEQRIAKAERKLERAA
jgi:hypothetical protein